MATFRLPGPVCKVLGALDIDVGTLCRSTSPLPGSVEGAELRLKRAESLAIAPADGKLGAADFEAAATALGAGVDAKLVRAFAQVESGGKSGFGPEGLPVIAYEGHIFRRLTGRKYDKDYPLLSYPYVKKAGPEWQANNKDQKTAWATLESAMKLDASAALQSCSWGMFQVMGFNYADCGYGKVEEFVAAMKAGERGQLDAFIGYCRKKKGLLAAMRARNYAEMARLYNGDDYGDYDRRIERAYKKLGGT